MTISRLEKSSGSRILLVRAVLLLAGFLAGFGAQAADSLQQAADSLQQAAGAPRQAAGASTHPDPSLHGDMDEPSIGGYSPVSYFAEGVAQEGSPEFAVTNGDSTYYLTSAEQVRIYNENPDRYKPRHKTCSWSLSDGKLRSLDPQNFKIVGDSLLLFHKEGRRDGLKRWNSSKLTDQQLLDRADNQVKLLKF